LQPASRVSLAFARGHGISTSLTRVATVRWAT
jgi:hypothetical protein